MIMHPKLPCKKKKEEAFQILAFSPVPPEATVFPETPGIRQKATIRPPVGWGKEFRFGAGRPGWGCPELEHRLSGGPVQNHQLLPLTFLICESRSVAWPLYKCLFCKYSVTLFSTAFPHSASFSLYLCIEVLNISVRAKFERR